MATLDELMRGMSGNNTNIDGQTYLNTNIEKYSSTPEIANQFKVLSGLRSGALADASNNIIDSYNIFEQATNPAFRQYINTSLSQGSKILSEIDKQKADVESFYGPGGTAQTLIDDYIVKYGNALTQQSAGNQALAKNTALKSGASTSAVRAVTSQQQADASKLLEFQSKKVADLTNLYNTYTGLISQLRAEASTANQSYILQPLAQILDRQTQIASALVQNEATLNQMKLSSSGSPAQTTQSLSAINELINKYETDPDSLSASEMTVLHTIGGTMGLLLGPQQQTEQTGTSLTGGNLII